MNRNYLYLMIGVLAAFAAVLGYQYYEERQATHGVAISVGKEGVVIEKK